MKVPQTTKPLRNDVHFSLSTTEKCICEEACDQRIDNFLFRQLKNVPKSHIYQLIRSGQVRVNSKRIDAKYRLQLGDVVRIPPVRVAREDLRKPASMARHQLTFTILYEDDALLIIDKPGGLAVHGGSGISFGVIEQLRAQHPTWKFLELVHRLDRETSGVLLLAKKRSALVDLHRQIREGSVEKRYWALVKGKWRNSRQHVKLALDKYVTATGERRVAVAIDQDASSHSVSAHTVFTLQQAWEGFSLLDAEIKTGRTHQIRVHLAHLGFPIAGDDKYGDFEFNKRLAKTGIGDSKKLARMFLHAHTLQFTHPISGERKTIRAPLAAELQAFMASLEITLRG